MKFLATKKHQSRLAQFCAFTIIFALVWLIVSAGDMRSLWLGAPVALATGWITTRYRSINQFAKPSKAHALAANSIATNMKIAKRLLYTTKVVPTFCFMRYFLVNSFKGAIDVSIRALSPSLPIEPHLIQYAFNNDSPLRTVAFVNTLSLMPGTIGAQINRNYITVHVLNRQSNIEEQLRALEAVISPLFARPFRTNAVNATVRADRQRSRGSEQRDD